MTADLYQVRDGVIVKKQIARKELAIYGVPGGGTVTKPLPPGRQEQQALADDRIAELAAVGRRIEAHYGAPQDIEWGIAEDRVYILQSRPITSLYPVPPVTDGAYHVFVNFGYIQVMTDPMKPLAISLIRGITGFLQDHPDAAPLRFLQEAGGRLFADLTGPLSIPLLRKRMLKGFGGMDELLAAALREATEREAFRRAAVPKRAIWRVGRRLGPIVLPAAAKVLNNLFFREPDRLAEAGNRLIDGITAQTRAILFASSGAERIRLIRRGMGRLLPDVLARVVVYWITGLVASARLKKRLDKRIGKEGRAALFHALNKSLPGNVTSEMGLALGDLADVARRHPEVVRLLERASDSRFYDELAAVPGGPAFREALDRFLRQYGMRGVGEIDITRPRWGEEPVLLVPSLLSSIRTSTDGEHRKKFAQGEREADRKLREAVAGLSPREGARISRLGHQYRTLMGMREHHKFALVNVLYLYKQAMLEEARTLTRAGVLHRADDLYYFSLEEIIALLEGRYTGDVRATVETRQAEHALYGRLKSPRVITSEGEMITGKPRGGAAPAGALIGTPVSAGIVEGTARIVLKPEEARLRPGEILVAPYTDPGWTPLFISAVGLITEVGGMMTHGSVVAREYGIPAVVGLEKATEIIPDGAWVRVDGTGGFVQVLKAGGKDDKA